MCGIVGMISEYPVQNFLLEGLKRLEYRGYDSAGLAVINEQDIQSVRVKGKVDRLVKQCQTNKKLLGNIGIAHTRWATHGDPCLQNAHPHTCRDTIAVVHNGVIENHSNLREQQQKLGFQFKSDTDTEVIPNLIYQQLKKQDDADLLTATYQAIKKLHGSYALGIISATATDHLIAVRKDTPLIIGIGDKQNYIASDIYALLPFTQKFIFLEDGDIADITTHTVQIYDKSKNQVERKVIFSDFVHHELPEKGAYKHYMLKEIYEQPKVIEETIQHNMGNELNLCAPDAELDQIFAKTKGIKIVACGTSYHAGLTASYWLEELAHIPCHVEIASEFRYRKSFASLNTLFIVISQSGETADTIAALRKAKKMNFLATIAICNVIQSSLTKIADITFLTKAGVEISVASTKAFTTQLVVLFLLSLGISKHHQNAKTMKSLIQEIQSLPQRIESLLKLEKQIIEYAHHFSHKAHILFLGRGHLLPIAMEGALKMKEISYIHAEAYPAGELKHGPLALIDEDMPIIALLSGEKTQLKKMEINLQEVHTRGGILYLFVDKKHRLGSKYSNILSLDIQYNYTAPILYTIPLQLLAYHVAALKGLDIDQPRNLAKSVTVE